MTTSKLKKTALLFALGACALVARAADEPKVLNI
jgi:hypothetical protein